MNCFNGAGFQRPIPDKNGRSIKSMQPIQILFNVQSGPLSQSYTIAPVNVNNTIVIPFSPINGANYSSQPSFTLTNSTTLTLTSGISNATAQSFVVYIIEFYNVKSKQTGSLLISSGTYGNISVPISNVNPSKCLAIVTFNTTMSLIGVMFIGTAIVTSINNLQITETENLSPSGTAFWQILEFN